MVVVVVAVGVVVGVGVVVVVAVGVAVVVGVGVGVAVAVGVAVGVGVAVAVVVGAGVGVAMKTPIAVLFADVHLTLVAPACRAETDWLAVQAGYLAQVRDIASGLPVVCAGDIFDRWNPPPELINFALEHLPDGMLCVPGQHDLPNHRIEDMHRSGYGVLVQAGKITDLCQRESRSWRIGRSLSPTWLAIGAGWGQAILTPDKMEGFRHLAVVHRYCWAKEASFPGAEDKDNVAAYKKSLTGYDAAVFGDNHIGFTAQAGDCLVYNCGGFIRRKSDELDRQPAVGLLFSDGTIARRRLDISKDRFHLESKERDEVPLDVKAFIDELAKLGEQGVNFQEAVRNHLRKDDVDPETRALILKALEHKL